jgi:ribonuclease E
VQFGAISKFGLLEMSRQRLKPMLSEGASIPCPRCGGSGHIRDTESSALQILRIIQEESLKDSTAAVLVQVPVEVASFLLNEKRTEITKIELKQRINVLMVPNKSLDTPNYKLERLKHDDPRLDNLDVSYKMADVPDDVASFTRRSQERTNKQEPLIKGVLPDGPAPTSVPRPQVAAPVPAMPAVPAPAKALAAPAAVAAAPAEKGFFGWLKGLFGANEAASPAPVRAPTAAPAAASAESRDGRNGEARRDGRGGRGSRGGSDSRGGRGVRGEGRGDSRGAEGRSETREPREPRGEGRVEGRSEGRNGERRSDNRGEGRGENRGESHGEVRNGSRRDGRRDAPANADANVSASNPASDAVDTGERRERRGRNDGRRRSGAAESTENSAPKSLLDNSSTPDSVNTNADEDVQAQPATDAPNNEASGEPRAPRERRGRDRYGRDRRERAPRDETTGSGEAVTAEPVPVQGNDEGAGASPVRSSYFTRDASEAQAEPAPIQAPSVPAAPASEAPTVSEREPARVAPPAPRPLAVGVPQATEPTPAPVPQGLPEVESFVLPIDEMNSVAQTSGLEWVNSNAEKVAQVQAAIAAEPRPIHVPREPKPLVTVDEGPLVLVETRKDLRNMPLPFETPSGS